jgi:GT2 family glycosyltransferase
VIGTLKNMNNNIHSNNKDLTVIIVSYNKVAPVIRAIRSIVDNYEKYRFIIIDNSESFSSFETLKMSLAGFANLILIKNPQNYGFAKSVNQGIEIAIKDNNCQYILLLNDDAYVDKNCIPKLIDALESNDKALIAGPTIYYEKYPSKVWSAGGYFDRLFSRIRIPLKNKEISIGDLKKFPILEVDFLTGCVLMIKREAIEKVGFFDETFFFYSEDLDYSFRVKEAGYKCLWVPGAIAWHDIDLNIRFSTPFVMYNLAKSGIIFRLKHFRGFERIKNISVFILIHTFHKFIAIFFSKKDLFFSKEKIHLITSWFKGLNDGFNGK